MFLVQASSPQEDTKPFDGPDRELGSASPVILVMSWPSYGSEDLRCPKRFETKLVIRRGKGSRCCCVRGFFRRVAVGSESRQAAPREAEPAPAEETCTTVISH